MLTTQTQNGRRLAYLKAEDFAQALIDSLKAKYLPVTSPSAQPSATADPTMQEWSTIANALWNANMTAAHKIARISWVEKLVNWWKAMRGKPVPPPSGKLPLAHTLSAMINQANGDPTKVRKQLQTWFDNSMERVGGWYKGQTQLMLLVIGIVLAMFMNIDTISITNSLLQNPAIRSTADQLAAKVSSPNDPALISYLSQLDIPLGWPDPYLATHPLVALDFNWLVRKIIGLLVTAFAVSQGAPFWFDMLNKVTNLRSAGTRPETAVESTGMAQLATAPVTASTVVEVTAPPVAAPQSPPVSSGSPRQGQAQPRRKGNRFKILEWVDARGDGAADSGQTSPHICLLNEAFVA